MRIEDKLNQGVIPELEGKEDLPLPEKLSIISKSGKAREYGFQEGDEVIIMIDNKPHTATIIAFNHYKDDKGNPCGITFQLDNLDKHSMNSDTTNKGGYVCSDLRKWLEDTFNNTNITDGRNHSWKEYIRQTNIDCYVPEFGIVSVNDHFFLLSVTEIFGSPLSRVDEYGGLDTSSDIAIEGVKIPYLQEHAHKKTWDWTRSVFLSTSFDFWDVYRYSSLINTYASGSSGVVPCFSI